MKFDRFTKWSCFTNWGWYSPLEKELLKLEENVITALGKVESFVRNAPKIRTLTLRCVEIQTTTNVKERDYAALKVELERMLTQVKEYRLEVLDKGGKSIPTAPKTFSNRQANDLVNDIRAHLGYRKAHRAVQDPFLAGFVIHYQADLRNHQAKNFHSMIATGRPVLWALDVDGYLSIGDPLSNKHSVVGAGKDVYGAGVAQLEIDGNADLYLTMLDCDARADALESKINEGEVDKKYMENVASLREMAKTYRETLNGWTPPLVQQKTIVLDFSSGHYTPSQSWRESAQAWKNAGYVVKWSRSNEHV